MLNGLSLFSGIGGLDVALIEFLKQYPQQAKEAFKILMGLIC